VLGAVGGRGRFCAVEGHICGFVIVISIIVVMGEIDLCAYRYECIDCVRLNKACKLNESGLSAVAYPGIFSEGGGFNKFS
jgi:hypothetical protein